MCVSLCACVGQKLALDVVLPCLLAEPIVVAGADAPAPLPSVAKVIDAVPLHDFYVSAGI